MIPMTDELRADADPAYARMLNARRYATTDEGKRCAAWIGEYRRCGRRYHRAWWHRLVRWHRATLFDVRIVIKAVDTASYVLDRMAAAVRVEAGDVLDWTLQARASRNRDLWARLRREAGLGA